MCTDIKEDTLDYYEKVAHMKSETLFNGKVQPIYNIHVEPSYINFHEIDWYLHDPEVGPPKLWEAICLSSLYLSYGDFWKA